MGITDVVGQADPIEFFLTVVDLNKSVTWTGRYATDEQLARYTDHIIWALKGFAYSRSPLTLFNYALIGLTVFLGGKGHTVCCRRLERHRHIRPACRRAIA